MEDDDVLVRFGIGDAFWTTMAVNFHVANRALRKVRLMPTVALVG